MRSGAAEFNERITLLRHDTAADEYLPLEKQPTVWAAAISSGDEQFEFRIDYRSDLIDLEAAQPAMHVVYRGRTLELINVVETDRRTELRLTARGHRVEVPDLGSTARRTTIWP